MNGNCESGALRVCMTGGWFSSDNVGDNAILEGIRDCFPASTEFTVFSSAPDRVQGKYGIASFAPKKNPLALLRALRRADALVFTGGTPFYDDRPHSAYFAALAATARLHRVPIAVFGIAMRTLSDPFCAKLTRFICNSATFCAAREERSLDLMTKLCAPKGHPRLLPDPAIMMRPIGVDQAETELAALGLEPHAKRVAVCLRDFTSPAQFQAAHYSARYTPGQVANLLDSVAGLCSSLVKEQDTQVVFLPMNTQAPDDDRVPARTVRERIGEDAVRKRLFIADKQYGPREMKGLLGRMDAVLGLRFHSVVLSSSMNVPTYAIAYAPKNEAIMRYFGAGEHVQQIENLDAEKLARDFSELISHGSTVRNALRERKIGRAHV